MTSTVTYSISTVQVPQPTETETDTVTQTITPSTTTTVTTKSVAATQTAHITCPSGYVCGGTPTFCTGGTCTASNSACLVRASGTFFCGTPNSE